MAWLAVCPSSKIVGELPTPNARLRVRCCRLCHPGSQHAVAGERRPQSALGTLGPADGRRLAHWTSGYELDHRSLPQHSVRPDILWMPGTCNHRAENSRNARRQSAGCGAHRPRWGVEPQTAEISVTPNSARRAARPGQSFCRHPRRCNARPAADAAMPPARRT